MVERKLTGAHYGLRDWAMQRATAVIMLVYTVVLLVVLFTLPKEYSAWQAFDIPHAVIYLGYDFGKGWSVGSEIEFEHGGSGSAIEYEADEAIEFEHETEKGGEVELEQFWLQKSFSKAFNIRAGHIVVPFGLVNAHHEPLNFFTVYRPEGENTILPSTWHQTGISWLTTTTARLL